MKSRELIMLLLILWGLLITPMVLADLNAGLVAYYPFNGNAQDMSGNGNHGTVRGAMLTTDRFGNTQSAYSFDGVDDYIDVESIGGHSDFSIVVWVNPKSLTGYGYSVIQLDDGALQILGEGFPAAHAKNHFWYGAWKNRQGAYGQTTANLQPLNIRAGQWSHLVMVARKDLSLELYVNGVSVATSFYSDTPSGRYPDDLVGAAKDDRNNLLTRFFDGVIDDIRIYNRPLSESEIQALYDMTSDGNDSNVIDDNPSLSGEIEIPMELAYWEKVGNGNWQVTDEGIRVTLTDRDGVRLDSKAVYNFVDSELFIKRKLHTDWGFGCSGAGGMVGVEGSVGNAYFACGSTLLPRDTWYYSRIKVNSDQTYTSVIAMGDYDTNGGTVIKTNSGTIPDDKWEKVSAKTIYISFGDVHARYGYMVVGEVKLKTKTAVSPITCQLYAVQDHGLNDSQLFTINPNTLEVNALGNVLPDYDIEALDAHPDSGALYAASGDNTTNPGHLYTVNLQTGALTDLGSTGFAEIEALTFHPNGTLWAWAKGDGLISIDWQNGSTGTLIFPSPVGVEGLTWNQDGTLLYAAQGSTLWVSDGHMVEKACDLPGQTEALEMLPDNLLLVGVHGKNKILEFKVMDLITCDWTEGVGISTDYDDVEGIAWSAAKACQ